MHTLLDLFLAWALPLLVCLLAVLLALWLYKPLVTRVAALAGRAHALFDDAFFSKVRGPGKLIFCLLAAGLALSLLPLPESIRPWQEHVLTILWILVMAWLAINLSLFGERALLRRMEQGDNLSTRKMLTRFTVLQRIFSVLVALTALGAICMSFEEVRALGMSLLASAGLAGIIIGFSAQRTIASILAGIQIAFTQPIRLDDVVIVEGEWGWIEEITFTYVVVRIWDLRRLVVPITHFLEKPFQNWTRVNSDLLGSVFLHLDYTAPVREIREELQRICREEAGDLWDGKVCGLQMTDADARGMVLRCLMSAPDSGKAWNLRCLVREQLVTWLAEHHPRCLPRQRWLHEGATPVTD
jgi:small-conductance mechanosensitive channel